MAAGYKSNETRNKVSASANKCIVFQSNDTATTSTFVMCMKAVGDLKYVTPNMHDSLLMARRPSKCHFTERNYPASTKTPTLWLLSPTHCRRLVVGFVAVRRTNLFSNSKFTWILFNITHSITHLANSVYGICARSERHRHMSDYVWWVTHMFGALVPLTLSLSIRLFLGVHDYSWFVFFNKNTANSSALSSAMCLSYAFAAKLARFVRFKTI